jgi:N-acetyl-anhydromuramyl-L-alanine amidase AmpD
MFKLFKKQSQDYYKQATPKSLVVLHYTGGGTLAGAEATLSIRDYVNVHYAIDRDGTVIQYFDEAYWAYHTGKGRKIDKYSIGIEVVNWGHLTRKGNELLTWTGKSIPWPDVVKCKRFRGFQYWQSLTEQQESALTGLLEQIQARHPGIRVCTHASLNKYKLDYPPDYPLIKDLVTHD